MIVDIAFEYIAGYCSKHIGCRRCKFGGEEEQCIFQDRIIPEDWPQELKKRKDEKCER